MATILIIDDENYITRMLIRRLGRVGHTVETADNGQAGVEKALNLKPDLILLDMHMPVMDGYTAARTLRSKGYAGFICAFTASAMVEHTNKSLDAGCDAFISKPIENDFETKIEAILTKRELPKNK
ncbi:MAG: response regulator [Calditrichaeota bacterium]|nr:MAG: response regulator [Calditrichota bacterium]